MITLDGFVDTYYAYDFNHPHNNERFYTTQAERSNEPSINLAYVGATFEKERFRSRLAIQGGNSVEVNYAAEANPDIGYIQEGYVGYKVANKIWVDAGIYFSHIGAENWISKNNLTYTRSLMADYSPYYATGVRLVQEINERTSWDMHLLNGWQILSETNKAKSIGFQIKHRLNEDQTFTYNSFLGDENVLPEDKPRFRQFHDFIWEQKINDTWKLSFAFDIGMQAQQEKRGQDIWSGSALIFQQRLTDTNFLAYRIEYYSDPHELNIETIESAEGFKVTSASINYDHNVSDKILWRTEFRTYYSKDEIFPTKDKDDFSQTDNLLVTSLGVSF